METFLLSFCVILQNFLSFSFFYVLGLCLMCLGVLDEEVFGKCVEYLNGKGGV